MVHELTRAEKADIRKKVKAQYEEMGVDDGDLEFYVKVAIKIYENNLNEIFKQGE
mgnify:FL=1|tara:strand:+ start:251 stop:415 length:165 start_codon:yes stop_codon:yes gene_type:complete